jgi:hypothetical protein
MDTQLKSLVGATARGAIGLLAAALLSGTPAIAAKVGYYDLAAGQGVAAQATAITAAGHTPVLLSELSETTLASVDVLYAQNPSNSGYGGEYSDAVKIIMNAVNNGLILVFADRRVTEAAAMIPGASTITFVRDPAVSGEAEAPEGAPSRDINIANNSTLVTNGPGGTLTNASLDGGNFSNHGHAVRTSLPAGSVVILVRTSSDEAVTFSYQVGAGAVVYTTVPLDAYLTGEIFGSPEASANFKNIYGPNLIAYGASLAEQSSLGPISLRYCHSASHSGPAACTRDAGGGQIVPTTGKVATQTLPVTGCAPDQPTKGTANVSITPVDNVTVRWSDLNCGANDGSQSIAVNPITTDTVGTDVQLHADAKGKAMVKLRVVPRDEEDDDMCEPEERPARAKRIVVETLEDDNRQEKRTINGDERIDVHLATTALPDDVITSAAVKFWIGRKATGAKTIVARAFRNGEQVGEPVRRTLLQVPKTSFSELQVYTPANFGNNAFDKIEFRAASGSWFGLGSVDLQTTRPASP